MTPPRPPCPQRPRAWCLALLSFAALAGAAAQAATPAELLAGYSAEAATPAAAARGRAFFNATHGREWSCASCHGATPVQAGRHAGTGKAIAAFEEWGRGTHEDRDRILVVVLPCERVELN